MRSETAEAEKASVIIKKFVTLGLGEERYGIDISKTREIIAKYEIVPLPKTPDFIEGIISLRGDIIPVVDLRKRFELENHERDTDTRVIVVELAEFTVGVQVDKVFEVLKLSEDNIEPPPPLVSGLKADYLEGVAEINDHLITILNLEKIFSTNEKLVLGGLEENDSPAPKTKSTSAPAIQKDAQPESVTTTVSSDGMIELRGKSYFVGKKFADTEVELKENGPNLSVLKNGKKIKDFSL
ncbi:MAG: chemotaxis protein CheW [Deltaproteobacteria bacterium]|nr:chemotaxis protein CheW [Deltaproteobacteria bacterium]